MREREILSARIFGPQESFCIIHAVHFSPLDQSRFIGRHWRRSVVTQEVFQAAATCSRHALTEVWLLTLIFFRRHAAHFSISRSIGYERFFPRAGPSKGKSILTHLQKQAVRDCQTPKPLMRQIFMIITTCIDLKELELLGPYRLSSKVPCLTAASCMKRALPTLHLGVRHQNPQVTKLMASSISSADKVQPCMVASHRPLRKVICK
jgi:hypothetical protein